MKLSKQQAEQFAEDNPKIAAAVPNLRENEQLLTLNGRLIKLRADLEDVRRSIAKGHSKTDSHAAAELIAAGGDIAASAVTTDVAELRRQERTLEDAIQIVSTEYQRRHRSLISDFCQNFEPKASKYVIAVLDAMSATLAGIEELDALFSFLSSRGYKTDGDKFCLSWVMRSMLNGGRIPRLDIFIGQQKELWGLSGKKNEV